MLPKLLFISTLSFFIFPHFCTSQCVDHQKNLLLQLKHELIFNSSLSTKLVQWNLTNNCCQWYGVECDDTSHVISLQLDDESISGGIGESSTLFRFKYLEKLNLAYNDFYLNFTPIPKGVGNLTYLTHLNLSHAGFSGQVPLQLSLLRRLVSLDISNEPLKVEHPNLDMLLQNLKGLRELYLDQVNITSYDERINWSHIISSYLPNITTLSLRFCYLSGPLAKSFWQLHSLSILRLDLNDLSRVNQDLFANFSSLTTLSLVGCNLKGSFPNKIFHIPTLQHLHLSYNELLSGSLPPFPQNGTLKSIRLRMTNLSGLIPTSIGNLKTLSEIDLSDCEFRGPIPSTFANLTQLSYVDLSSNFFTGPLSSAMFEKFSSLVNLDLGFNSFSGNIPNSLFGLPSLETLYLQHNKFIGTISQFPTGNVSKIVSLDLSNNRLDGPIPDFFTGPLSSAMFEGFSSLVNLDLGFNSFTGNIPDSLFYLPSLQTLHLKNNKFIGPIEEFSTGNVSRIFDLDLSSNTRLDGPIPDSFFQLQSLVFLDLSGNSFSGRFQLDKLQSFANLIYLDLSGNNLSVHVSNDNLSGPPELEGLILTSCNLNDFPHFIKHSYDMQILDLSNNRISGEIPSWIWRTPLTNLNLSFNLLTHVQKPYHIPPSLATLDLQSNQLREELHLPFQTNITSYLQYLSLGNNSLSGSIPTSLCTATYLEALDLSMNKLSGTIPSCLLDGNMIILSVLDVGRNNISGHIPDSFTPSCMMEYFDVNNNSIEGKIPKSIKRCKGLEVMNVGNNIISDTFPCMLSSSLRVLVLHSNRFHGEVKCYNSNWKELQIIDISRNNFSGSLQSLNFSSWRAMVVGLDGKFGNYYELGYNTSVVPKVGVRLTMKGLEIELVKIYPDFTAIDFSCNNFRGELPNAIGDLSSLRLLNFSHNTLNGSIPKSFGKLGKLESLDLSRNKLTGHIPMELSHLTFLSVLNVSYNKLVGEIPKGQQLQTFSADSFIGNLGLCGFNLNISCTTHTDDDESHQKEEEKKREIEWEYVSAALGYAVGLGSFAWLLIFCQRFRVKYFGKIEEVVEDIFEARRRRTLARRRLVKNRQVRRH